MAEKENKRVQRKNTKKEGLWQFMRRNPRFCVSDAMLVTGATEGFCKTFLWHLEKVGYVRMDKGGKMIGRQYTLLLNTGPQSPAIINGEVYDYNTGYTYTAKGKK